MTFGREPSTGGGTKFFEKCRFGEVEENGFNRDRMKDQVVLPPEVERLFREDPYYYLSHPNWRVRTWPPLRVKWHLSQTQDTQFSSPLKEFLKKFLFLMTILICVIVNWNHPLLFFITFWICFGHDNASYMLFLTEIRKTQTQSPANP
jgi:hypothetical protein